MNREIRWPTVGLVGLVVAGIVAIFAFAGPDERVLFLSILSVLGTAGAAVMRAAFGAPKATPKRLEDELKDKCPECESYSGAGHAPGCSLGDDDGPGEGGEVLAEDPPPAKPRTRVPTRIIGHPRSLVRSIMRNGIALACLVLSACSPSALRTHATIASVTGHVFDTACSEVETARSRDQHAIADGPLDRDESRVAVDAVRAHWAPALASCELAADTHDAWVTTLALAAAGAPFTLTDGLALAQQALSVWQSLSATLMIAGVEMPAVPAELVALVGGGL